jgi:uncharacterized protein
MKQALLIFSKNIISGHVKTRIAATMGNEAALAVYQALLSHTNEVAKMLPVDKIIFYSNAIEAEDLWDNRMYKKQIQSGSDLGSRMQHAFQYSFEEGNEGVAIIGTDCFEITSGIIMNAFAWLKTHDIVIGPATDGGYYLLAMKQMHRELLKDIPWSSSEVLKNTLTICDQLNLSVYLLPQLSDVDTEADLTEAQKAKWLTNLVKND